MTFEEYLISKKIDGKAFQSAEPELYKSWDSEFTQMHPNSFTAQKLYLINPLRLKYTAKNTLKEKSTSEISDQVQSIADSKIAEIKPPQISKPARPVFKPKPKI